MSHKTKAELQAENEQLRNENKELHDMLEQTLRHNKNNFKTAKTLIAVSKLHQDASYTLRGQKWELQRQNTNRGGQSYKQYRPVYFLAGRYYRRLLLHDPEYFPGKAARKVSAYCLESSKYKHVPSQERIKVFLKNNKQRLIDKNK